MFEIFRKTIKEYWDYILYLVIVTITLTNFFEEGMLIAAMDGNFPLTLNAINIRIEDYLSLINNAGSGELFNPFPIYTVFPYLHYLKFLGTITGDIHTVQKLFYFTFFFASYTGTRIFVREFFNLESRAAYFISGISYAMNPISDFLFTAYLPEVWLAYCFFPLVLYYLIAAAKRKSKMHYVLFLIFYHVFLFTMLPNAPYFLVLNVLGLGLFVFYPEIDWPLKLKLIAITGISFAIINLIDFFILYQYFGSAFSGESELFSSEKPSLTSLQISSQYSSILNVFRLMHLSGFNNLYWENGIAQYSRIFYSLDIIPRILSFVPIIVVVAGVFLDRKRDKIFLNTLILCLIFIFLAKSIQPPFGSLFYQLFENFSIFQIFRSAPEKFGLALTFLVSILLGKSYAVLVDHFDRLKVIYFNVFIFVVIIYFRLPWMTGDIITDEKAEIPSFYIKVPEYYLDYEKDMQNEKYKTILNLPSYGRGYLWGLLHWGYFGVNLLPQFSDNKSILSPVISGSVRSQWLRDIVSYNLGETIHVSHREGVANLLPYLSLLGIKEIVVDMDRIVQHEHYTASDPRKIAHKVEKLLGKNIRQKKVYGEGKIIRYILNDQDISDELYIASDQSTFVNFESLKAWKKHGFPDKSPEKIAVLNNADSILSNVELGRGALKFTKISPSKYQVDISQADGSALLVFSKEFNNWWTIKPAKNITAKHILVNDYANGWIITPNANSKNSWKQSLILEFELQKYSDYRNFFKTILLLLGFAYLFFSFIKNRSFGIIPQ